jgi:hypothetical protein
MNKKLRLATNVWRTGTLSAVYWATGRYGEQVKLVGSWEAEGPGYFYLPASCVDLLTDAGLVAVAGINAQGEPVFRVVNPGQRIGVIRREQASGDGRMRVVTEIVAVDAAGKPVQLPPQPRLQRPTPAATAAAPATPTPATPIAPMATPPVVAATPTAATPTAGTPIAAPVAVAPAPAATVQATQPQATQPQPVQPPDPNQALLGWEELSRRYAAALVIAHRRLRQMLGPNAPLPPEVLQAAAATILISADREQLKAPPGVLEQLEPLISSAPQSDADEQLEEDDDLPF